MRAVLAVFAGGMVGALARVAFSEAFPVAPGSFPLTTFLENVVGAFLLGVLLVVLAARLRARRWIQPFLAVGVLGSFTTFSNLAVEAVELLSERPWLGLAYPFASVGIGLPAAFAGMRVGRRLSNRLGDDEATAPGAPSAGAEGARHDNARSTGIPSEESGG